MSNYLMGTDEDTIDQSHQGHNQNQNQNQSLPHQGGNPGRPPPAQSPRGGLGPYNEPEEDMFRLLQYNVYPPQIPNSNLPPRMLDYTVDPVTQMPFLSHPQSQFGLQVDTPNMPQMSHPSSVQLEPFDLCWQPIPGPVVQSYPAPRGQVPANQWSPAQVQPEQPQLAPTIAPNPRGSSIGFRPPREQSHSAPDLTAAGFPDFSFPGSRSRSYPSQSQQQPAAAPQDERIYGLGISTEGNSPPHSHPAPASGAGSGPGPGPSEPRSQSRARSSGNQEADSEEFQLSEQQFLAPDQLFPVQQSPIDLNQVPPWMHQNPNQRTQFDYGLQPIVYEASPQQPQQSEMHTSYGVSQRAPSSSTGPVPQAAGYYPEHTPRYYGTPSRPRLPQPRPPGGYYWSVSTAPTSRRAEARVQNNRTLTRLTADEHTYVPIQLCEPPLFNVIPPNPSALNADPAPRSRKKSKYSLEQDQMILDLKMQGYGWGEIAQLAKCDKTLAARNRYQVLIGQQGGGNFVWSREDIQELQGFLDEGERAKWAFISEELSRRRGRSFTLEMCHHRISEMFRDNPERFGVLRSRDPQSGGGVPMRRQEYDRNYSIQEQLPRPEHSKREQQPELEGPDPTLDEDDETPPPLV